MSEPKRLHPVAVIFNMIKTLKEWIFGAVGIVALALKEGELLILGIASGVMLMLILLVSFLKWLRYTYAVEGDELRIEQGIFIRKKRYISKNRIQAIDLTQSVIHRLTGLVRVEIETAGSGSDTEASLKAVAYEEGVWLREQLKYAVGHDENAEDEMLNTPNEIVKKQITFERLFIAGSTSGSLGVLAALAGVLFTQLEQVIPAHVYDDAWAWVVDQSLIILGIFGVIGALLLWMLGIAGTMIKYGHFTITRQGDELFIQRGLLEKKQITVPLKRIQAIGFRQSVLRQPFGFGTLYAEIAGALWKKTVTFPLCCFRL
ncbi:UPF0699 transmembrane protein YdbT [Lentibacillus sp. JNUCC-1]|uniref:PH domain-containing protein n=1 Tax=Lentibacillus sp. JNUCC-1 TaxID=2654513 RepID=UPI0013231EE7|nr:PH domain-containing protein [Lentibacillus sp. JNUCC-1]MUV38494.1 UPF0699 transmembrane protein YdbT [Lentibacillus sp. JNUCC-1]